MKSTIAVLCLLVLNAVRCGAIDPQPGPPLPPSSDVLGVCRASCDNLIRLSCDGADGSPGVDETMGTADDVPCWKVCYDLAQDDPCLLYTSDAADECVKV